MNGDSRFYDTKHCPRCGRSGLRFEGFYDEGKARGTMGGNFYSCSGCHGWFSSIELRRLGPPATFKGPAA